MVKRKKVSKETPSTQEDFYKLTGNPLIVWDALLSFKLYHDGYNPDSDPADPEDYEPPPKMPQWIMDYLGRTAQELLKIDKTDKQAYKEVRRALGFKDARIFSKYHEDDLPPREFTQDDLDALGYKIDPHTGELGGLAFNVWYAVGNEQDKRREQRKKKVKSNYKKNVYLTVGDIFGIGEEKTKKLFNQFNKMIKEIKDQEN
jgi:hypothetical protein